MSDDKTCRAVMWRAIGRPGLERAIVQWDAHGVTACGVSVGVVRKRPFSLRYTIRCDAQWRTRYLQVESLITKQTLALHANGRGRWINANGDAQPHLEGCIHPDLSVSPLTNTLPIRHAQYPQETAITTRVVYIDLPAMQTAARDQRYVYLRKHENGATYRYVGGITARIDVDRDGLVITYPDLFERVPLYTAA